MVGLDVTHKALLMPDRVEELRGAGKTGKLVAELYDFYHRFHAQIYRFEGSPVHDAVAVADVIRPGIVETLERNVEVDCASELCRGRTVVDVWRRTGKPENAKAGIGVDAEGFVSLLVERITSLG
jgi:inosine-uridine nucleoside N-ribohydrolase